MKSRVKSTVWNDSPVRERFISDPKASVPTRILSLPEHGLIAPQKTVKVAPGDLVPSEV